MRTALDEAMVALEHGDVPVGAVLVRGEEVIARGHNTRELMLDASAHAEMNTLRLGAERVGGWRLEGVPRRLFRGKTSAGRQCSLVELNVSASARV